MGDYKQRTFTLPPGLSADLNEYADENDMAYSQVVARAIDEYLEGDQMDRIESKIDTLLAEQEDGGGSVDRDPSKNKDSSEASADEVDQEWDIDLTEVEEEREKTDDEYLSQGPLPLVDNQTEGKANRMFNYLLLETDNDERIKQSEVDEAITTVGRDTAHFRSKYRKLLKQRLKKYGWNWMPELDVWFKDDEEYERALTTRWENDAKPELTGKDDIIGDGIEDKIDRLNGLLELANEGKEVLLENEADDEYGIKHAISEGERRLKKLERKKKRREGDGGGA